MDASRWQRAKDAFQAALTRGPETRRAFLDEACGTDIELRREVESLLAAHAEAGAFLSRPVTLEGRLDPGSGDVAVPSRIGSYRLVGLIAQGGMGTVYRAVRDDDTFQKTVALKLVRVGLASELVEHRFRQERQILARLQHPNIAAVHDGGTTPEGQPYLVMEYVEGRPITQFCAAGRLDTRARLALFQDVCAAVHYAHQNLVIHRDLKPGNILVTATGVPKLLDFGIAKLLAPDVDPDTAPTATLLPMMTPEYASPEQVKGDPVTTASDVYSLGVLLYELLAGRLPYEVNQDSLEAIVHAVCDTEPKPPSAAVGSVATTRTPEVTGPLPAASELRGDLDTIVLKALRKEPARRYSSAQELSEDIRRHLQGLPVMARADTFSYRAGKFVRRHRTGVAAVVLVAVSLIGGIFATVRQARIAEANRRRAERRFADVRRLAGSFLFEFHDAIQDLPGSTSARKLLVTRALEYLDGLAAEAGGDEGLQAELAAAYQKVGDVQGLPYVANLGDTEGALRSFERAHAIRQQLLAGQPRDAQRMSAACASATRIGKVHVARGEIAKALQRFGEALPLCEQASRARGDAASGEELLWVRLTLGDALRRNGEPAAAVESYRAVLATAEALVPKDRSLRKFLAMGYDRLGQTLDQQRPGTEEALAARRQFVAVADQIAGENPSVPRFRRNLGVGYENLAAALVERGLHQEGLEAVAKAQALYEALAREDPGNVQATVDLASACNVRAKLLGGTGRGGEALDTYAKGLSLLEGPMRASADFLQPHLLTADALTGMGELHVRRGDFAAARGVFEKAVATREMIAASQPGWPENRQNLAVLYASLARVHLRLGSHDAACRWFGRATDLLIRLRDEQVEPVPTEEQVSAARQAQAACRPPL